MEKLRFKTVVKERVRELWTKREVNRGTNWSSAQSNAPASRHTLCSNMTAVHTGAHLACSSVFVL